MEKVLMFEVGIEGLENKIWRKIEILDSMSVADLGYTILASFNSLAYHLYKIVHDGNSYYATDDYLDFGDPSYKGACEVKLKDVDFSNKKMYMEYDFGSTTAFTIKYSEAKDVEDKFYPNVIDGAGWGMLDDVSVYDLQDMVNDIDKKGYSDYYFSPGYDRDDKYDYRMFDLGDNNVHVKEYFSIIKKGYETEF